MLCIHIYKTHQSCAPAQHGAKCIITSHYEGLHIFRCIHTHIQIHSYTHTYVVYTYIQSTPKLRASTARCRVHHVSIMQDFVCVCVCVSIMQHFVYVCVCWRVSISQYFMRVCVCVCFWRELRNIFCCENRLLTLGALLLHLCVCVCVFVWVWLWECVCLCVYM